MSTVEPSRDRLLDAEALAARWGVPRSHVYHLAREGRIPVVTLGKYKRFALASVEEFESKGGTDGRVAS